MKLYKRPIVLYSLLAFTAVIVSVFFLDRPIADLTYKYIKPNIWLGLLSKIPVFLEAILCFFLVGCISKAWRDLYGMLTLNLLISLAIAWILRTVTKWSFGRTWPKTWIQDNPSWVDHRVEGFYPFSGGTYMSFPSGHALITCALVFVYYYHYPKLKSLWIGLILGVILGQLGSTYHYLGDLLSGIILGFVAGHMAIKIGRWFQCKFKALLRKHDILSIKIKD